MEKLKSKAAERMDMSERDRLTPEWRAHFDREQKRRTYWYLFWYALGLAAFMAWVIYRDTH